MGLSFSITEGQASSIRLLIATQKMVVLLSGRETCSVPKAAGVVLPSTSTILSSETAMGMRPLDSPSMWPRMSRLLGLTGQLRRLIRSTGQLRPIRVIRPAGLVRLVLWCRLLPSCVQGLRPAGSVVLVCPDVLATQVPLEPKRLDPIGL